MFCPLAARWESKDDYPVVRHNFQSKITLFSKLNFKCVAAKIMSDNSKKEISNDR